MSFARCLSFSQSGTTQSVDSWVQDVHMHGGLRPYKASENEANYTGIFKAYSHNKLRRMMKALQYSYENMPLRRLYVSDNTEQQNPCIKKGRRRARNYQREILLWDTRLKWQSTFNSSFLRFCRGSLCNSLRHPKHLLDRLLKAGLVLIHGGMDELIDVVFQIFEEGSIIRFLLPAWCHSRVFGDRWGRSFCLTIAWSHLNTGQQFM